MVKRGSGPSNPAPASRAGAGARLGDHARAAMRSRRFSARTEQAYLRWMIRFHGFTGRRNPAELGAEQVTAFLSALATRDRVAASTQNQALAAILFLYRDVLGQALPWLDDLVRAKTPVRIPVVLTRDEVRAILARTTGTPRLMGMLLYGSGLRLLECCRLRVKDVDFSRNQITVRRGKGDKDRATMLPQAIKTDLTGASGACAGAASRRPRAGRWLGGAARHPGAQASLGRTRMGLAVGVPGDADLRRARDRAAAASSSPRDRRAAGDATSRASRGNCQARDLPHAPALVRDAPARGWE
jgi:integrase